MLRQPQFPPAVKEFIAILRERPLPRIEAHGLVKRHGSAAAVSGLPFSIRPGLASAAVRRARRLPWR